MVWRGYPAADLWQQPPPGLRDNVAAVIDFMLSDTEKLGRWRDLGCGGGGIKADRNQV
jgi:hypothetical protein